MVDYPLSLLPTQLEYISQILPFISKRALLQRREETQGVDKLNIQLAPSPAQPSLDQLNPRQLVGT